MAGLAAEVPQFGGDCGPPLEGYLHCVEGLANAITQREMGVYGKREGGKRLMRKKNRGIIRKYDKAGDI